MCRGGRRPDRDGSGCPQRCAHRSRKPRRRQRDRPLRHNVRTALPHRGVPEQRGARSGPEVADLVQNARRYLTLSEIHAAARDVPAPDGQAGRSKLGRRARRWLVISCRDPCSCRSAAPRGARLCIKRCALVPPSDPGRFRASETSPCRDDDWNPPVHHGTITGGASSGVSAHTLTSKPSARSKSQRATPWIAKGSGRR
jgi:hypothetical protein